MPDLDLTVQFSTTDAHNINAAGQQVTIVKQVGGSSGSQVAWVTFGPFENNIISWEESYGVYASSTQVQNGAMIQMLSVENPASSAVVYPFENGTFGTAEGSVPRTSYAIENETTGLLTFGLVQAVTANGNQFNANPLNAVTVLNNEQAQFTPIEIVSVFLHGDFNNGVVISNIASNSLSVDLTTDSSQTIHYTNGQFVAGPLP